MTRRTLPILALLFTSVACAAADPPWYVRKGTWQETMLASREARAKRAGAAAERFRPFNSGVIRGGEAARRVRLRVGGATELWLIVTGVPTNHHGYSDWADARLIAKDGKATYLSSLKPASVWQSYGRMRMDRNARGGPLRIGDKTFQRGIGVHADSRLRFALGGKYEWFEAWIGIDYVKGKDRLGHVRFEVTDRRPGAPAADDRAWRLLQRDFADAASRREMAWEREDGIWAGGMGRLDLVPLARRYAEACRRTPPLAEQARKLAARTKDATGLGKVRALYYRSRRAAALVARLRAFPFGPLRRSVAHLTKTYGRRYPKGADYLRRLSAAERSKEQLLAALARGEAGACERVEGLVRLRREALLANPLLDFDRLLLVKRRPIKGGRPLNPDTIIGWDMGFPRSSFGHSSLPKGIYDNEIAVLSPVRPDGKLTTLYRPKGNRYVGDVDLHFDADRLLLSMRDDRGHWQVYEIGIDSLGPRQVSRDQNDVDSYDACYLPDGGIVFCGSACFQGVPCNKSPVEVLYRMDADGRRVRQLCFEQDHDFDPCVLPNGRVLYLRWEYSDLPHSQSRILFSMNPDGTGQMEVYGSNSYWPNSVFGARAVPGKPHKIIGVVAGHHGSHREGELVLFDTARAKSEADGAVQRIPGRGKRVQPIIADQLTAGSWPKFIHPWPLSDQYFLVTCKLDARSPWDLYLVDVFDNLVRLYHVDDYGLFEPIPLRKTPRPPVLPDRTDPARKDGLVYLTDVYRGGGLAGVPRGTVRKLRLLTYHFAYQGMGGLLGTIGMDGPWDIKQVIGTVPVAADGSAYFRVPANTPISVQPLDAEGKALQLMRSWFVAMPGETLSCVGCHERQADVPPNLRPESLARRPARIDPWPGKLRGFSFKREVQPVLDRHCVGCHNGQGKRGQAPFRAKHPTGPAGEKDPVPFSPGPPDLRGTKLATDFRKVCPGNGGTAGGRYFSVGYVELSRYVRRPGIESDLHRLAPLEFHADTTQLVQMLTKGHHDVQLDAESWRRLITWIDLNAPYHGTWTEIGWDPGRQRQRRRALRKRYAGVDEDPEGFANTKPRALGEEDSPRITRITRRQEKKKQKPKQPGIRNPQSTIRNPRAAGRVTKRMIDLGGGVKMDLVLIPAGEFVMGDAAGDADERPLARVRIDRAFWMGACEVSNAQYARFDPTHDSRVESKNGYQFGVHGYPLNQPTQPVVRVSWRQAGAFCRWLSAKTGERFALPTEAQWEYACRAGTDTAFSFGGPAADFSKHANLADRKLRELAGDPYTIFKPLRNPTKYDDWVPRDNRFDDGGLVTMPIGSYRPNAWGARDLHGNVFEWTRTVYRPYPYRPDDGRNDPTAAGKRVVRGGSWRDRPKRCRSAFRLAYPPWQVVYNVGFRVVAEPGIAETLERSAP